MKPSGKPHTKEYRTLALVVPLFNEAQNVEPFLNSVLDALKQLPGEFQILFVDDGSIDETWLRINMLQKQHPMICALRLSRNFGKEAAIAAGLEAVDSDLVILMDGDLQHPPSLIPEMVHCWQQNPVEIVEAVKSHRGRESAIKGYLSRAFYRLFSYLAGFELQDASDFKLLSRKAVNAWSEMPERSLFFRGMSTWIGFPRHSITFPVQERSAGSSGWKASHLFNLAISAITAFSSAPLRLVALTGALFGLFALFLGIETLVVYFSGSAVSGFTTVIILMLLIGSALMFGLTIIGEYIARIYEEIKGRPRYLIDQRIGNHTVKQDKS